MRLQSSFKDRWILVISGARSLLLVGGYGPYPLEVRKTFHNPYLTSHDPHRDRPGRDFQRYSSTRHAYEAPTDWKANEESLFLTEIGEFLEKSYKEKSFKDLVVCASPKLLGQFRKTLSSSLIDVISKEIPKDLTHLTLEELREALCLT